jgi:hypothetical protein
MDDGGRTTRAAATAADATPLTISRRVIAADGCRLALNAAQVDADRITREAITFIIVSRNKNKM